MIDLEKIFNHKFIKTVMDDMEPHIKDDDGKMSDIEFIPKTTPSEFEYYTRQTAFFSVHLLELCDQLKIGLEVLSDFNYSKKKQYSRAEHLTYNLENLIIRLTSLNDRTLQLINATYHLGIDEKDVKERVIMNNIKVSRTAITKSYRTFKNTLQNFIGDRNTIVHRHSFIDKELKQLQIFYNLSLTNLYKDQINELDGLKTVRQRVLTEYLKKIKAEFSETINACFLELSSVLDDCLIQYSIIRNKLK